MEFRNSQAGSNARRYPEPTRANATTNENTMTQGGGAEAPARSTMQMQNNSNGKFGKPMMVVIAAVVVILLVLGGWFAWSKMAGDAGVKGGQYQAVFLTNGQVYFGKVSDINGSYVKVSDIYYLQVQQSVQPDDKTKTSTSSDSSQVSLAKLGSELHGPEDTMYVSRQQVLFWENLKNDGKVVQAINSYKQSNK
jgi:hypothetical protein